MRSMMIILNLVLDKQITTKEEAAALVDWEVSEMMQYYDMQDEEARRQLLANINHLTKYLSHKQADNLRELFDLKKENN